MECLFRAKCIYRHQGELSEGFHMGCPCADRDLGNAQFLGTENRIMKCLPLTRSKIL
jgi:hypothetical protein